MITRSGTVLPPASDNVNERKRTGIDLVNTRGFSVNKASKVVKVDRRTLQAALNRHANGESPDCVFGRPRKLTVEGQQKLVELTTDSSKAMKGLKTKEGAGREAEKSEDSWQKAFQAASQVGKPNARATTTICRSTMYNYRKVLGLGKEEANTKNKTRVESFNCLRTPICFAAMVKKIQELVVPDNFHSVDDVSVLVNGMTERPQVITTTEAKQWLNAHNLSVATEGGQAKQRVVQFCVAISGAARRTATIMKFYDRNFTRFDKQPLIMKLDEGLWVCLSKYGINEVDVQTAVYDRCIIPAVDKIRADILSDLCSSPVLPNDSDPLDETNLHIEPVDLLRYQHVVIAQDGADAQIKAIERLRRRDVMTFTRYFAKYAGGCSMIQSGNDIGKMHVVLHNQYKSPAFIYGTAPTPIGRNWMLLKAILKRDLDNSSFNTIWKTFTNAPLVIDKAFTRHNIRQAFDDGAIICGHKREMDLDGILSTCPQYHKLSTADAEWVLENQVRFDQIFDKRNCIPEKKFESILGERLGLDNCPPKYSGKPLNEMSTNRQRCLFIHHFDMEDSDIENSDIEIQKDMNAVVPVVNNVYKPRRSNKKCCGCSTLGEFGAQWNRCRVKSCRVYSCGSSQCDSVLESHIKIHTNNAAVPT